VNLTTGVESVNKFLVHFANGEHAGLVHLIAVIAYSEVHQDRFMGFDDPAACTNGKGWRKTEAPHGRIRLAYDSSDGSAQHMPTVSFVVE